MGVTKSSFRVCIVPACRSDTIGTSKKKKKMESHLGLVHFFTEALLEHSAFFFVCALLLSPSLVEFRLMFSVDFYI